MEQVKQSAPRGAPHAAAARSPGQGLCEYLVAAGKLNPADVARALRLQGEQEQSEPIGSILVKLGFVSERDVAQALADQLGLPLVDRKDFPDELPIDDQVSPRFLKENKTLILSDEDGELTVATADPLNRYVLDALGLLTGKKVLPRIALASEIESALEQRYAEKSRTGGAAGSDEDAARFLDDAEHLKELASEAPVIKLVNLLIHQAVESGASDIHIEPFENRLKVRYRVDGLLREVQAPPTRSAAAVVSRIKIMANLNIAERRLPQDGRFKVRVRGNEIDLRVSTVPIMHGESVVLRLLHRDDVALDFGPLGFTPEMEQAMRNVLALPHGILLVTGPTGSGKTTTLYAAINELDRVSLNVTTIEDPVEYTFERVNQTQVNAAAGLTFASGLRAILRQDPDVILVGEIRDRETAEIATQASMTGHLVLSSMHATGAVSALFRLLEMGIEPFLVSASVTGVFGQRLMRRICSHCRIEIEPTAEEHALYVGAGLTPPDVAFIGRGCTYCAGSGYLDRIGAYELLRVTPDVRRLVAGGAHYHDVLALALKEGLVRMRIDALHKAAAGITTLHEAIRSVSA